MDLVPIFEGMTPIAEMLRAELRERGIESVGRRIGVGLQALVAYLGEPPFTAVLISRADYENRRAEVDECLALYQPDETADDESTAEGEEDE